MPGLSNKGNMTQYATRIDDVYWGDEPAPPAMNLTPAAPPPVAPLLYPSEAALAPATAPHVVHHVADDAANNARATPPARAPLTMQDIFVIALLVLVTVLCIFCLHLSAKLNSVQTLVRYMSMQQHALGNKP